MPTLVDTLLNNKILKETGKAQIAIDLANGNYTGAINDFGNNVLDRGMNTLGIKNKDGSVKKNDFNIWSLLYSNPITAPTAFWGDLISGKSSGNSDMITDSQIENMIRKSDLSNVQKADLRKAIVESGISNDKVVIQNMVVNANNFDEIMESLKQAQANRR